VIAREVSGVPKQRRRRTRATERLIVAHMDPGPLRVGLALGQHQQRGVSSPCRRSAARPCVSIRRAIASSVSGTSSPIFDSRSAPQHVQAVGPGTTTRSRGRCSGKRLCDGLRRTDAFTRVVLAAAFEVDSSKALTPCRRSSSCAHGNPSRANLSCEEPSASVAQARVCGGRGSGTTPPTRPNLTPTEQAVYAGWVRR